MIHIVEGTPGSGKTYYAVNYLIDNFFDYDSFYDEYKEKSNKNVLVISNIDSLRVPHLNLDVLVDRFTLEKFFTVDNFEKIQKQYRVKNIVVIIDEAQKYFDRKFYNKDVFFFFQYHRHLGVDIFLITQSKNTLAKELVVLAEYIVRALPRSVQPNSFIYHFYTVDGDKLFTKSLRKKKDVFRAYSSMKVDEITKPKNVVLSKVLFAVVAIGISLFSFYFVLNHFFFSAKPNSDNSFAAKSVKPVNSKSFKVVKPVKSYSSKLSKPKIRSNQTGLVPVSDIGAAPNVVCFVDGSVEKCFQIK